MRELIEATWNATVINRDAAAGVARLKSEPGKAIEKQAQSRALVLSGGGTTGGAWMAGYLSSLRGQGVDLGDADLIIGTSAGARTAAQLATGTLGEAMRRYRRGAIPAVELHATLPELVAASMRVIAEAPDKQEAARRIANMGPLGGQLASDAERRRMLAALVPATDWPGQRLLITAVDAESGHRVAFGSDSGAGLLDAVAASGALPGIFPLVTIDGRRYADGGVHSLYNADLAAGHDVVTVLTPMPLNDHFRATLEAEVAALGTAAVHVLSADQESLAAIGPNPIAAEAVPAAADAGLAQARRDIARLRGIWPARAGWAT
jgi:NTE family protein